ncbi:sal-like protein 3 [Nematolebias whitei]|uniref:sal-like protein 3 n=1 Tax=Nematolebias whitei TaxID=451745 RepID=UPI001897AB43|nr:sal-like protein 3 [Nematolebias whitei]
MQVKDSLVTWIRVYLTGRPQYVKLQNTTWDTMLSSTGAPQGPPHNPASAEVLDDSAIEGCTTGAAGGSDRAEAGGGSNSSICERCCAHFFSWPELSQHQKVCTEDPVVLIVKDNLLQDSLMEPSPVPSVASSDSSAAESTDASFELTKDNDSLDILEEGGREWDEVMELDSSPQDKYTTFSPQPPDSAESTSSQASASGSFGIPSTNVTLEILHSTRVAVAQFSQRISSGGLGGKAASATIPVILEHLLALQQQQVHQLQLIEQICSQVAVMNRQPTQAAVNPVSRSLSLPSNPGTIPPSILPLSGAMPTVNGQATVSLSSALEQSQSVPSQTLCGQLTSASSENSTPSLSSSSSMSTLLPLLPHSCTVSSSQTPSSSSPPSLTPSSLLSSPCSLTFLPQSPPSSSVIFPNPLASIAATTNALDPLAALMKQRKGKLPNMSLFETKPSSEEPFFKHKCRFCAKVFGSDSALQIHLRSHTGERPFKCNICGNRFSTKGNLKVHFQRHKDKYPHVHMNPFPVPEYLDNVPTSSGIPYGMSVPPEKPASSWLDSKPVVATLTANVCLPLSSAGSDEPVSVTASVQSYQAAPGECVSVSPNYRGSEGRFSPISDSNPSPVSCCPSLMDSMQTSETLKLQQLVENIDKKITDPNQCTLCHRVLSCQSALKMHYRVHTGERPFRCKVCGRAFTTKGNLKTHIGVHRESSSVQAQHSCPICQKKFTNALVLQQHVRLHVVGHTPDALQAVDNFNSLSSNELTDDVSMEEEEEEEEEDVENIEEEKTVPKPFISDCRSPSKPLSSSATALEDQMRILNHCFTVTPPTNGVKDSLLLSADGVSSEKKVEVSSKRSPRVSESSCSPSSPLQSFSDASRVKLLAGNNKQETHEVLLVSVKREQPESPKSAADPRAEPNKHCVKEEPPYSLSCQLSRDRGQNLSGSIKAEVNGHSQVEVPFSSSCPSVGSPGVTSLLGPAPPRRAPKQHNCSACRKNFSSASALQIHERTHTGEKPFVCSVCGRAFTTKGNLKVHMGTHMWNNAPARRGRRLSVENPGALLRGEALKFGEAFQKDLATRAMSVDPGFWSRYAAAITNSLAMKNNEISVIQNPGLVPLHPLTAASVTRGTITGLNRTTVDLGSITGLNRTTMDLGSITGLNRTTVDLGTNRHFSMLIDDGKEIGIN